MNPAPTKTPPVPQIPSTPPLIFPPSAGGPPNLPHHSKFPLFLILGEIILIVLIATIAYFLGKSQNSQKVTNPSPSPTSTLPTSSPTPNPIANWKTYTNNVFGFSIRYPKDWNDITTEKTKLEGNRSFTLETANKELIHGVIFNNPADQQNSDTAKNIDLKNGKSLLLTYVECDGPGCNFGKKDITTFTQILSTFKFLDEKDELSCQTDSDCGIESCGCKVKNKNFIDTSKGVCTIMCGTATCVNNKCTLQPYKEP